MRQRDWRRYSDPNDLADFVDGEPMGPDGCDIDGRLLQEEMRLKQEEMRLLLLQETITRAKDAEAVAFRYFEQEEASGEEWRLLLMDTSPTVH